MPNWFPRVVAVAASVYVVGISAFLLLEGTWPTPDFLIPPLVLAALAYRRGWTFVIDWTPFLLLILAYEAFRGVADDLNARVHVSELIAADQWLAGGWVPTLVLQERFYDPGALRWYDYLATILHAAHFVVPVAAGFAIWIRSRALFWRYVLAVVGMFFVGFAAAYFYPAAPPWLASEWGALPTVHRVLGATLNSLTVMHDAEVTSLAYQHFSPNAVAAMPSLHAATPMLLALILIHRRGLRYSIALAYPVVGGVAWIYLGEHYLVDVLMGWLLALGGFVVLWVLPFRIEVGQRGQTLRHALLRFSVPLRVPAWPLAAAAVAVAAFAWMNPMMHAPLQRVVPTEEHVESADLAADTAIDTAVDIAAAVEELGLVGCDEGHSTTAVPDLALTSLVERYAGFIQGIDAQTCFTFTIARGYEPLSARQLRFVHERVPLGSTMALESPRSGALLYVASGFPSNRLRELSGLRDDEPYLVVLRVAPGPEDPAVHDILRRVSSLVFRESVDPISSDAGDSVEEAGGDT